MIIYKIRDWDMYYENLESRKRPVLRWIPVRCKLNGRGYRRLMEEDHGPSIFGCWIALLEVAANGCPRGVLADNAGSPYTAEDLAFMTGFPKDVIAETLTVLSTKPFDWIETT